MLLRSPSSSSSTWQQLMATALIVVATSFNAIISSSSAFSPPPPPPLLSWDQLRATPALSNKPPRPIYHQDALPGDDVIINANQLPILYRDRDCICAASETVWLAMECKGVDYLTVLVSKEEDDEAIPRIKWPDDSDDDNSGEAGRTTETDPIKLLEEIQKRYPTTPPHLYPKLSSAVDASRCNIMRLPGVMPRYSNPRFMSSAPYIFRDDGTLAKMASHCVSLEEIEEMQEEYYLGPYLCGRDVTAADMVWAPHLERYAIQLPLIFPNKKRCDPRSKNAYGEVAAWYDAMERVPAYACCVQGDARHWRKCLERVIPLHNEECAASEEEKVRDLPPVPEPFGWWMEGKNTKGQREELWKRYANESRPWLADTPAGEVALYLMRNRGEIVAAAATATTTIMDNIAEDDADEALREVVQALLSEEEDGDEENVVAANAAADHRRQLSKNGQQMAKFASDKIEVPRDLGMIPAMTLGELVLSSLQQCNNS